QDGNYEMLSKLVIKAKEPTGLPLGREAKNALDAIKSLGDRSAHNPRFSATQGDLDKVESGVRVVVDELLTLADLRASRDRL
ncbi:hypothetical protein, partial [Limnospira sp. PMC 917.15]|uniref:hypothetical protein n=1 Tax=Limnospira sp. PMC 917.15 TaxID=2981106 RepID=UPI0028E0E594